MTNELKQETVSNMLRTLHKLGRVSAYEFALSYWPEKYTKEQKNGSIASKIGSNFLWKLKKQGLVSVFVRRYSKGERKVFEVSDLGKELL